MENKELLTAIASKLKEDFRYVEGDGQEFGEPDKIVYDGQRTSIEIQMKTGNSWYFSGCTGIRLVTYGLRTPYSSWFSKQYKLIDLTGDLNIIWEWLDSHYNHNDTEDLKVALEKIEKVAKRLIQGKEIKALAQDLLREHACCDNFKLGVRKPKIQYGFNDLDQNFEARILEVALPHRSKYGKEDATLIIQVRQDKETDEISYWYTFRVMTTGEGEKRSLIRLDEEQKFEEKDLAQILQKWIDNEKD